MSEALPDSICPTVLDFMRLNKDTLEFRQRLYSLNFKAPVTTPLEQLAEAHGAGREKELGQEHLSVQTLQFYMPTILLSRTASVIDWSDPKKRMPGNGLRFFRARTETSAGDRLETGFPVGECFWGTSGRPSIITGGLRFDPGASLVVFCLPRIRDIEVELGFCTIQYHYKQGTRIF